MGWPGCARMGCALLTPVRWSRLGSPRLFCSNLGFRPNGTGQEQKGRGWLKDR
jgi:hypothetical protein